MTNTETKSGPKIETPTEIKKVRYFLGTYPEKDWPRMFIVFVIILVIVIFMGTSMYFSYMNTSPTQSISSTLSGNATTATDVIFEQYTQKEEAYNTFKGSLSGELMVPDPSL